MDQVSEQRVTEESLNFAYFGVNAVPHAVINSKCRVDKGSSNRDKVLDKVPVFDSVLGNCEGQQVLVTKMIDRKLERVKDFVLGFLIFGHKIDSLIESQPHIEPCLSLVGRVHRNVVNFIIHFIAVALIAITQINF